jgi:hypothetical protein
MKTCYIPTGRPVQQETLRDSAVPCGLVGRGTGVSAYAKVQHGVVQRSILLTGCRSGGRSHTRVSRFRPPVVLT